MLNGESSEKVQKNKRKEKFIMDIVKIKNIGSQVIESISDFDFNSPFTIHHPQLLS